jgi:hypothetical protein
LALQSRARLTPRGPPTDPPRQLALAHQKRSNEMTNPINERKQTNPPNDTNRLRPRCAGQWMNDAHLLCQQGQNDQETPNGQNVKKKKDRNGRGQGLKRV